MSLEKARLKIAVAEHIGLKHEDRLEAATAEVHRYEGAAGGVKQAGEAIERLLVQFTSDADDGKIDDIAGEEHRLKIAELVSKWMKRAIGTCIALGDVASSSRLKAMGKVEALEQARHDVKNLIDEEEAKAQAIESGVNEIPMPGKPGAVIPMPGRKVGVHPGPGVAAQRKHELPDGKSTQVKPAAKGKPQAKPQGAKPVTKAAARAPQDSGVPGGRNT